MQVLNQRLSVLKPIYTDDITKTFDDQTLHKITASIIEQLYVPLAPQFPVEIKDDNGNPITTQDIVDKIVACTGDVIDVAAEKYVNEFWSKTMSDFMKGLNATSVFLAQANAKANMPLPSANVLYTPADIRDGCNNYLSTGDDKMLIANTGFCIPEHFVGVYFLSAPVFNDYKAFVNSMVQTMSVNISNDDMAKFNTFNNMQLNLMEGLMLRTNNGLQDTHPYAFARILMNVTLLYVQNNPQTCGIIAPYIDELIYPTNLILLDADMIAKSPVNKLDRILTDIRSGINTKWKPVSLKYLTKLSAIAQSARNMTIVYNQHMDAMQKAVGKRALFRFNKVPMTKKDLSKQIRAIIKKEVNVAASENYAKTTKLSYMRANRRQPDNFNLPGISVGLEYKPDIHIYPDTSGSISEENYKNAILTLITMAKKLDVNLYFNSFSDVLSGCAKLKVRGKSEKEIYKAFQKVPKVEGGTDFTLVWDYITESKKRMREISVMVTDFGFRVPSGRFPYPKKMYYIPIDISPAYWSYITEAAKGFCEEMYHIDQRIRSKILL